MSVFAPDAPPLGSRWRRLGLAYLLVGALTVGLWATLVPRGFYDSFPGMGRVWVAVDGPFNEHLVRDVGGLYLALAVVTVYALVTVRPGIVRMAGAAWLAFGVPHLIYHVVHRDVYDTTDQVLSLGSLGATVVVAALLAVWPGRPRT